MPQQVCRFRVVLPTSAGGEDNASLDFIAEATGSNMGLTFADQYTEIESFFNSVTAGATHAVGAYLASEISRGANACTIKTYDVTSHLDGSPAGSPVDSVAFTLVAALGSSSLPPQAAVAVGMRADYGSAIEHGPSGTIPSDDDAIDQGAPPTHIGVTKPRARLRSRFFLGPLVRDASQSIATAGGAAAPEVSTTLTTDVGVTLHNFLTTHSSGLPDQWNFVVWSRRSQSVEAIRWFYINENFGTVRRRIDTTEVRVHNWVAV